MDTEDRTPEENADRFKRYANKVYKQEEADPDLVSPDRTARVMARSADMSPLKLGILPSGVERRDFYSGEKLGITCHFCYHHAILNVKDLYNLGQDIIILGCSKCGKILQRIRYI